MTGDQPSSVSYVVSSVAAHVVCNASVPHSQPVYDMVPAPSIRDSGVDQQDVGAVRLAPVMSYASWARPEVANNCCEPITPGDSWGGR